MTVGGKEIEERACGSKDPPQPLGRTSSETSTDVVSCDMRMEALDACEGPR
jgi:hypothetical protein